MADIPETSSTLLRNLASDREHVRWTEFVARYEPIMRAFLKARFPSVEADDVLQETLVALVNVLPNYRYAPDEEGRFHNFLTGILRNKALKHMEKARHWQAVKTAAGDVGAATNANTATAELECAEDRALCQAMVDIVLAEFFSDTATAMRTKEIFRRVAMASEDPAQVAAAFGVTRHTVDQIKARTLNRLRARVAELEACCG